MLQGTLNIADTANNLVKEWTASNGLVINLFSVTSPSGVALDGIGDVYVANQGNLLSEWNSGSGLELVSRTDGTAGVAADHAGNVFFTTGYSYFAEITAAEVSADKASGGTPLFQILDNLYLPTRRVATGVAGNAYYGNYAGGSAGGNVVKERIAATGKIVTLFGTSSLSFGLATDGAGNVYGATAQNSAIYEWSTVTQQTTTLVSTGLNGPQGVAVDSFGNLYIADTGKNAIEELPYAFIPTADITETAAAGSDQTLPVLPITAPFTATSDQTMEREVAGLMITQEFSML